MKKFILVSFLVLLFSFVLFYFWGSRSQYNKEAYNQIVSYSNQAIPKKDSFSIMTYNIGYLSGLSNNKSVARTEEFFSSRLSYAKEVITDFSPDIIAFQEIDFFSERSYYYNQLDSLGYSLNYYQAAYAVNWDKLYVPFPYWPFKYHFGEMCSGQAILSKMQIIANDLDVLTKPINAPFYYNAFYIDRILQVSKVQLNNDTLVVMNVHLEAFDQDTRELQAAYVLKQYQIFSKQYPVILLGDFNCRPPFANEIKTDEKTIRMFLAEPGLMEVISEERYLLNESDFYTYNSANPYERIDYIFYSSDRIKMLSSQVIQNSDDISDHLPVVMTFQIIK